MADDIATTTSPTSTTGPIVKPRRNYTKKAKDTAADLAASAASEAEVIKEKVVKKAKSAKDAAVKAVGDVDWKVHGDQLKDQAAKTAISAAGIAKDKGSTAMQSLSKLISDTAGTVDAKLGPQYGDYARYAAEAVSGAAKTLEIGRAHV